jgi:hypothetical protein
MNTNTSVPKAQLEERSGDFTKVEINGYTVARLAKTGDTISTSEQSSDLFGNAWFEHFEVIAIPTVRLAEEFFSFSTGFAGEIVRKSVSYNLRLAILGDIEQYVTHSSSFNAFVEEANKGEHVWFLANYEALITKLTEQPK